jgi:uncharacterized protein YegJ (DUF2314 family)
MTNDKTQGFSPDDAEMEAAITNAKETFGLFLKAFFSPTEKQKSFLVKVVFVEEEQSEHIWIVDLIFSGQTPRGVIANEPTMPNLKFMQKVEFHPSQITDWMYIEDGYLIGGYTTKVIRKRMNPSERKAFDTSVSYKFREVF